MNLHEINNLALYVDAVEKSNPDASEITMRVWQVKELIQLALVAKGKIRADHK